MTTTTQPAAGGDARDAADGYDDFHQQMQARVAGLAGPLFTTATTPAITLFDTFLGALPTDRRQHYTCNACRRFVNAYGGLVSILADGRQVPALWDSDAPPLFRLAVHALFNQVSTAAVKGVFVGSETPWGTPFTNKGKKNPGPWRHLSGTPPAALVYRSATKAAHERAAELGQDFAMLTHALHDFSAEVAAQAVKVLRADALYRAEKVLCVAEWFERLHAARAEASPGERRDNVTWLAVATAPAGYCHLRSTMIGTLLEDIAAGLPFGDVARRFGEKMDPTRYRRPTAAPSAGQVDAAERAVQALGIAPAFARRYAGAADLAAPGAVLWAPSEPERRTEPAAPKPAGVFAHLKPAAPAVRDLDVPPKLVTWEKFARDVLPGAAALEYVVPLVGNFCALTAAADPEAAPILQWDAAERRNSVSWSFPSPPARADEWGLTPGARARVRAIVAPPSLWHDGAARFAAHGRGVFLLLDGARDGRGLPGGGLFPEHLRGDLMPYRATIEAHVNALAVVGADAPDAAFGVGFLAGGPWTEAAAQAAAKAPAGGAACAPRRVHVILVVDDSGSMGSYLYAARAALVSLIEAVRAMPGQVDATFVLFGNHARIVADRVPLAALEGIACHMNAASGGTALNDALGSEISRANALADAHAADTSFFLGIVTDGEENASLRHSIASVADHVRRVLATGRWTIAYAGAGRDPRAYAHAIGIPPGNVTAFEASARGFDDIGRRYSTSTIGLAAAYAGGARASTSFFAAAGARQALGTDHPVLVVTSKSGAVAGFTLDRWE